MVSHPPVGIAAMTPGATSVSCEGDEPEDAEDGMAVDTK